MSTNRMPRTRLCRHTNEAIYVRGASLVDDLIGELTFTEMAYFGITGRRSTAGQTRVLDAVLVTLMEHGLTPSAIAARMVYSSTPESLQAGVAAGLLAVGSVFVGTMEGCAHLLTRIVAAGDGGREAALAIAREHRDSRARLPGFGHNLHRPDDPRTPKLLALGEAEGMPGAHIAALRLLSTAVDEVYGRHITVNATGAVAALLAEIGIPADVMRGIAVVSRSAGLVAHIAEEQADPAMRHLWETAEEAVPYTDEPAGGAVSS